MKELVEQDLLLQVVHERVEFEVKEKERAGRWKVCTEYKSSGIECLGEIPSHWKMRRLKFVAIMNSEVLSENTSPDYLLQYVDIGNVDSEGGITDVKEMQFSYAPSRARRLVKHNDIIISTVRTYLKAISHIESPPENLVVSTGFAVLRPHSVCNARFLWRLLQSNEFVHTIVSYSQGVSYPAITPSNLSSLPIWLPPLLEQRAITSFLDRETTRINTLIAKKEQHIALLQERCVAIINQAVTKGLNADVPMKDSGIEWSGKIPEHWEVRRIKHAIYSIGQGWSPSCENRVADADEWGVLKVGCVNGTRFNENENKALPKDLKPIPELEIKPGDILMSRANTRELLGSASIVRDVRPGLLLCDKLYRLRINREILLPDFFVLIMRSSIVRFQLEREATGASSSMQNISQFTIVNVVFPVPDIKEQQSIVTYLERETTKIDKLITGIQKSIKKLKEYSTTLISAAVTGKIDVRGEVAAGSAEDVTI